MAFVANDAMVNRVVQLRDEPQGGHDDDISEFLRQLALDAGPPPDRQSVNLAGPPQPTAVTLFLTTACNLRCTYCYASAGDTELQHMPLDVAKQGIDFVIGNARVLGRTQVELNYHGGGEPTVNWRVLTGSYDYACAEAARFGIKVVAAAASNGVLSDSHIDWIIEHLEGGVSLSFDGLPEVHDHNRVTASGDGSAQRVMHTMRRFDDAGYDYGVRVTVTADQIPRLAESVEFIWSSFRPQQVQVEPSYPLGRWRDAPTAETAAFIDAYREARTRALALGGDISFSAARVGVISRHFCGVTRDGFGLSPDGNVSACYEAFSEDNPLADVFFYGTPDGDGYRFDDDVLANLRGQTVENRPWCQGCFAKWNCSGDCLHRALTVEGRGEFTGSDRCHITRALVQDELLRRIEASGGLLWSRRRDDQRRRGGQA